MNDQYNACVEKRLTRLGMAIPQEYAYQFEHRGNYTIAFLTVYGKRYLGVSKRNPCDRQLAVRGMSLALSRAVEDYATDPAVPHTGMAVVGHVP